jgi:predicted regulator of Ras-like GTPase activity (Roadblock/LC7/MglB family)
VEELLASPGIPETLSDTVRGRLAEFPDRERAVLEAAAVMGRHFDREILPAASGQPTQVVSRALARAVDRVLVTADGARFQFRHAFTREAVLMSTLPPRLRRAAANALAAVDAAHPDLQGRWRDVAADLAARSGDRARAGLPGVQSLSRGAGQRFSGGEVRQTIVEMDAALLFITAAGQGTCLAVLAGPDADAGLIAYEIAVLVKRLGQHMVANLRSPAEFSR